MTRYYTSTGEHITFGVSEFRPIDWVVFVACLPLSFPGVVPWFLIVLWQKWYYIWRKGALRRTTF